MSAPASGPSAAWGPQVSGETAAARLMRSLDYRLHPDARRLTADEVAVVLHALADHTALLAALDYRREPDGYWPEATSVGRWLHDTGDQLTRDSARTEAQS